MQIIPETMNSRDKIIKVATKLFHFYGYKGTSIDMLVKKTGVDRGSLYYHFEGKEELGLEVLTRSSNKHVHKLSKIMETDLNPVEQFKAFCEKMISFHRELLSQPHYSGSFFGNMALEQSSLNEKFRLVLEKHFQECETVIEKCLRKGIEQGVFNKELDPGVAARFIIAQSEGAVLLAKVRKSVSPIENAVNQWEKFLFSI